MATTTGPGRELETSVVFTPLGIQFWDFALDKPVSDGLQVAAQLKDADYAPAPAMRTVSGNFAFHGLPGLHSVEYPPTSAAAASPTSPPSSPPTSPPSTYTFDITILDTLNRFLPTVFSVDLPLGYPGLFLSNVVVSPPGIGAQAYLFSAPDRTVTTGMAAVRADVVVRADLLDSSHTPAAFAALQVTIAGQTWTGIADERGRAAVIFPYPRVEKLSMGSPPGTGQGPITNVSWPIQVGVLYQPSKLRYPLSASRDVVWPWNNTPSLKSILDEQQPALIWQQELGPPVQQWLGSLTYGQELVLRTSLADPTQTSPDLFIVPATSP